MRPNQEPYDESFTVRIVLSWSFAALMLGSFPTTEAGDWLQFRGNDANSIAIDEKLPTELSGGQ